MSLYVVERLTKVEAVHCVEAPYYNNLTVPENYVQTRFGRRFKHLGAAVRLAQRVGGWVKDLNGCRIVFDSMELTG